MYGGWDACMGDAVSTASSFFKQPPRLIKRGTWAGRSVRGSHLLLPHGRLAEGDVVPRCK